MGKRKTTSKKAKPREMHSSSRSWWANGGLAPVPAVNPNRPFDFQMGIVDTAKPFEFGSIQYSVVDFSVPDTWPSSQAFITTAQHLFQDIRENLRTNLAYSEVDLMAYLANVMFIQALFSIVQRDFSFKYFRDQQHPTFEAIWGRVCDGELPPILDPMRPSVSVFGTKEKSYLRSGSYAENLTYIETILIPQSQLLILPPACAEYCKWLFDSVFTDEMHVSSGQYYWNELRSIPQFAKDASGNLVIAGKLDSATMQLSDLSDWCTYIASSFGVIIADLKRCGAKMVVPDISVNGIRSPKMRYDEVYFTAIENAYANGYLTNNAGTLEVTVPTFFNVDFISGMNNDQMCSALSFLGSMDRTSTAIDVVSPLCVRRQYCLIDVTEAVRIETSPFAVLSNGTVSWPAFANPGIYALAFDSKSGNYFALDASGGIEKQSTLTAGGSYYFGPGYESSTYRINALTMPDFTTYTEIRVPIGRYGLGLLPGTIAAKILPTESTITSVSYNYAGQQAVEYTFTGTSNNHSLLNSPLPRAIELWNTGDPSQYTTCTGGVTFAYDIKFTVRPVIDMIAGRFVVQPYQYEIQVDASFGQTQAAMTMGSTLTDVVGLGTISFGDMVPSATTTFVDPTNCLSNWLRDELSHKIPAWAQEIVYSLDTNTIQVATKPNLLKETRETTVYNRSELEALLYQLYYSLFFVHAEGRRQAPKEA